MERQTPPALTDLLLDDRKALEHAGTLRGTGGGRWGEIEKLSGARLRQGIIHGDAY